jgi:subtilisin family serine protease
MLVLGSAHAGTPHVAATMSFNPMSVRYRAMTNVRAVVILFKEHTPALPATAAAGLRTVRDIKPLFPESQRRALAQRPAPTPRAAALRRRLDAVHVATLAPGVSLQQAMDELTASPDIEYAEPDALMTAYELPPEPQQVIVDGRWMPVAEAVRLRAESSHARARIARGVPSDPRFGHQWSLRNTGQNFIAVLPDANGVYVQTNDHGATGADIDWYAAYQAGLPTNEIIVAVVDTGVDYTHPELVNQMWHNAGEIPNNGVDDDGNGYVDDYYGYDFRNFDADPWDDQGHGTHCSGTIAAETDNGMGIAGIYPHAEIMAVKFLGVDGSGAMSSSALALRYAADNGARVINNSYGSGYDSVLVKDTVAYADEMGCIMVAAAGNNGANIRSYPAAYPQCICVGATDKDDQLTIFSNYGSWLSVTAPGMNILSLRATNTDMYAEKDQADVHIVDTNLYLANGTSMASPHAAGVAAILAAVNTDAPPWVIKQAIMNSSDNIYPLHDPAWAGLMGQGRVNAIRALTYDASTQVYMNAHLDLFHFFITGAVYMFLPPGATTDLWVNVKSWKSAIPDARITFEQVTNGFSISTNEVALGTLPAQYETNASIAVTMSMDKYGRPAYKAINVSLWSGTNVLARQTVVFYAWNQCVDSIMPGSCLVR